MLTTTPDRPAVIPAVTRPTLAPPFNPSPAAPTLRRDPRAWSPKQDLLVAASLLRGSIASAREALEVAIGHGVEGAADMLADFDAQGQDLTSFADTIETAAPAVIAHAQNCARPDRRDER
jgi:hypothetical protein